MQKFSRLKRLVAVAAVCAAGLAYAAPAQAAFLLRLSDGLGNSITLADNDGCAAVGLVVGACADNSPTVGALGWTGQVGTFIVNSVTGLSKPVLPSLGSLPLTAEMDLQNVDVAGAAGTLTIELSDNNFPATNLPGNVHALWGGTLNAGPGSSAQAFAVKNLCNNDFNGTCISTFTAGTIGPFGPGPFSGQTTVPHPVISGLYSMYIRETLTFTTAGNESGNFDLINSSVPEPGSMALLGTGLIALARTARRRLKKA